MNCRSLLTMVVLLTLCALPALADNASSEADAVNGVGGLSVLTSSNTASSVSRVYTVSRSAEEIQADVQNLLQRRGWTVENRASVAGIANSLTARKGNLRLSASIQAGTMALEIHSGGGSSSTGQGNPGGTVASSVTLNTSNQNRQYSGLNGPVTINASHNHLDLHGTCTDVVLNGADNSLVCHGAVHHIVFNGANNHVTWSRSNNPTPPIVTNNGSNNASNPGD